MKTVLEEEDISTVLEEPRLTINSASKKTESSSKTFEGSVVSMTGDKLVMKSKAGTAYSHTLATDAKLTCDGEACKAADLKAGRKIRVTTKKDDRNVAIGIEALNKNAEFTQCG